jgi:alpha-1,2-mannosyltransferase
MNDFEVYYYGGTKVLQTGEAGVSDLYAVRDGLPFTYPPFAALLFAGLATLTFGQSSALFIGAALAGSGVVSAWLTRHYFGLGRWRETFADWRFRAVALAGAGAIVLLGPWRDTFVFGQINIILMGLILTDFALHGKSRAGEIRWPAGLLIGIAAGIKLTPLVFGLYFLVRRDFKGLGRAAQRVRRVLDQDPSRHRPYRRTRLCGQPLGQGAAAAFRAAGFGGHESAVARPLPRAHCCGRPGHQVDRGRR